MIERFVLLSPVDPTMRQYSPPRFRLLVKLCIVIGLAGLVSTQAQATSPFQSGFRACARPLPDDEIRQLEQRQKDLDRQIQDARARDLTTMRDASQPLRAWIEEQLRIAERLECHRLTSLRDPIERAPGKEIRFLEVAIPFATDRLPDFEQAALPTAQRKPELKFTGIVDQSFREFSFGIARVTIPTLRSPGDLNLPKWWQWLDRRNPERFFQLLDIVDLQRADLEATLTDPSKNPANTLLLFVHGFNVTFAEATMRLAQLAHDLSFPGQVLLYSWPSIGDVDAYFADEDTVRISAPRFQQLLHDLTRMKIERIFVIAHSMGARLAIPAIIDVRARSSRPNAISELILAAADFNQIEFRGLTTAFEKMSNDGAGVTLYASSNDFALAASALVHRYPRLGEGGEALFLSSGIDSIDATNSASMRRAFGHSYISDSPPVLGDLQDLLLHRFRPAQRGLAPIPARGQGAWQFPGQ
ncbi:MAG: alpha/beta fold hydrolase [Burkholderiaceae bacterium]